MTDTLARTRLWNRPRVRLGAALLILGFLLNYVLENEFFFRLGTRTAYQYLGGWPNLFLPIAAFYLALAGLVLFVFELKGRSASRNLHGRFLPALLISLLFTVFYGIFYLGMQFLQTGADRLGECHGLEQAANTSHDIPESMVWPGHSAVGCSVEKYGMFLSYYNDLAVYGVTNRAAQDRVLHNLSAYHRKAHTHPMHIGFYEKENWGSLVVGKNGKGWGGKRGPEKLLRVVTLR
ncbi:MAG: hypothetical protein ACYDD2_17075 [Candidatus Acidiferrales bacterium]